MNFLYQKNYEKYLDAGCRRAVTSSSAHNMLWSVVSTSPTCFELISILDFPRDRCNFVFSLKLKNYKGAVLYP